jgi:hypothetical protein
MVYFVLIGPGGIGGTAVSDTTSGIAGFGGGGGSGGITSFLIPAFLVPDVLDIRVGIGGRPSAAATTTSVLYNNITLISANAGSAGGTGTGPSTITRFGIGGAGASAAYGTFFTSMGVYQSTGGQTGQTANTGQFVVSTTTPISAGGAADRFGYIDGQYGYYTNGAPNYNVNGFTVLTPLTTVPMTPPGYSGTPNTFTYSGIGGGGTGAATTLSTPLNGVLGGDGMVMVISW